MVAAPAKPELVAVVAEPAFTAVPAVPAEVAVVAAPAKPAFVEVVAEPADPELIAVPAAPAVTEVPALPALIAVPAVPEEVDVVAEPALPVIEPVIVDENVLVPEIVCVPVVIKPLAVADASGILKVCEEPDELITKSVPEVPVAKVCVVEARPFKVKPEPLADIKIQERLPAASELKTDVPVDGEVAGQIYVVFAVAAESNPV